VLELVRLSSRHSHLINCLACKNLMTTAQPEAPPRATDPSNAANHGKPGFGTPMKKCMYTPQPIRLPNMVPAEAIHRRKRSAYLAACVGFSVSVTASENLTKLGSSLGTFALPSDKSIPIWSPTSGFPAGSMEPIFFTTRQHDRGIGMTFEMALILRCGLRLQVTLRTAQGSAILGG
jgi:hypothetical protein